MKLAPDAPPNLPLIPQPAIAGIGTGRIEQISSFAVRYAEAQHVPFLSLYRFAIFPLFDGLRNASTRILLPTDVVIEGLSSSASTWTAALTAMSRIPGLRFCSMLPFDGAIAARRLVTPVRRWCPQCLEEMADCPEQLVYEPLEWRVNDMMICLAHDRWLVQCCPACGRGEQSALSANARVGCCRHCGKWLGCVLSVPHDPTISEFDRFCARACEELIALPQELGADQEILTSSVTVRGIRDVFFSGNGSAMARRIGVLPGMLNAYANDELPTPLHVYLRSAFVTGASMRQIFVSQEFSSLGEAHPDVEFELRRARSRVTYQQERVDQRLREAIAGDGEMSVAQIASSLNLAPVTVWRRSKALAKQAAGKHAQFVARRSVGKKTEFVKQVRALANRYKSKGVRPTPEDIKRDLDDPGCGINPWKRSVIDDIIAETFDWRYTYQAPVKGGENGNT